MMRVLIPTDFSANAYNALRYAKQLLASQSCTFYLLNTYTPAVYRSDYILESPGQLGLGDVLKYNAETNLGKVAKKIAAEFPNTLHQFVLHTAFNTLTDEITHQCTTEDIDLLVMGTQGATGAAEIFLGTNTVHALKKTTVPLLIIPPEARYRDPVKILMPTDYEVSWVNCPIDILLNLIRPFNSHIDILHLAESLELSQEQDANKMNLIALLNETSYNLHDWPDQDLIPAIATFMENHESEMLVMVRNIHHFFERLFREPVVKKIAFHIDKPFMVLPVKN